MKVYEIDDTEFKDDLIMAILNGDGERHYELHLTDGIYSPINAFYGKIFPRTLEDIQGDREAHYKNVIRWMYGRGVECGVKDVMDVSGLRLEHAGGEGNLDMVYRNIPYEIKTYRFKYRRDLPFPSAVVQLSQYMAVMGEKLGRIKIFDMLCLDERTWNVELKERDIKARRKRISKRFALLRQALKTGDWSNLPETAYDFVLKNELDNIEFLEDNPALVKRACRRWRIEARKRGFNLG